MTRTMKILKSRYFQTNYGPTSIDLEIGMPAIHMAATNSGFSKNQYQKIYKNHQKSLKILEIKREKKTLLFFFWNEPLPIHCPQPRSQRIVVCLRCFLPGRSTWEETLAIPSDNKAVDSAFDIIDHIKPLQILEDEIYNSKDFRQYLLQDIIRELKKNWLPVMQDIACPSGTLSGQRLYNSRASWTKSARAVPSWHATRGTEVADRGAGYHPAPKRDGTVQYNVWEPLKIQFVPICSNGNVCMFNWVW